ncbi:glycosyltransferase (partial) [Oceanobacillus iheyensis HTE831]|uniref:Glycosyltransferase (Partial) n=1 Tax=Oceanobacillus iheyensis (strain DSM 14371 / CIP 107618 / JCM 11309 / KCTC 3954 / HTE831) TaxID=221109 RepID=Q8EMD0_OCEIH|nr:glycosyltransferase family A protein [Oceanobacillus iheyensis]BAC14878.1 glycosyltransferase (partial) [Oceanobacillus iheyensis HTE831]
MSKVKRIIEGPVDWFLYTVMGEKQRKFILNSINDKQKEKLKQLLLGKKNRQRQELKQIKFHLYNLGFIDQGLQELKNYMQNVESPYFKRMSAWELVLWHANQYSETDANKALDYMKTVEDGESDADQLRRIAIIKAELLDMIGQPEEGITVIQKALENGAHPDLYLAMANLKSDLRDRFEWVNHAFAMYDLNEIEIDVHAEQIYDSLQTKGTLSSKDNGPLVSVIIPAYNAEDGIQVAIESILSQSWTNLELLIVDDCSPDDTFNVIKAYEQKDSRVKVFQTPSNSGPYVARNIALQHAKGDFVTINDSDDWSHASKIELQAQHLVEHDQIIANTSEHARITEDMKLYRRGTPGKYIFPNMSSIMFRREPVLQKIGYWDSVRFAADGEFKRRLLKQFGTGAYVDLNTGPLSLPRQSVTSLTGSSAFGYNGFFMGVRKEYVESLEYYHQDAENLYYPYPMVNRPYPVPEPMWPKREEKTNGVRSFDIVIAADYRQLDDSEISIFNQLLDENSHSKIGLAQVFHYDLNLRAKIEERVRNKVDGDHIHFIVYGEKIHTKTLILIDPATFLITQKYIPEITTDHLNAIITNIVDDEASDDVTHLTAHLTDYFQASVVWYAINNEVQQSLKMIPSESYGGVWDKGCISND